MIDSGPRTHCVNGRQRVAVRMLLAACAFACLSPLWTHGQDGQQTSDPTPASDDDSTRIAPPPEETSNSALAPGSVQSMPVRLDANCMDGTLELAVSHGAVDAKEVKSFHIENAGVTIFATNAAGQREQIDAATDASGRLAIDLGPRVEGTSITLLARTGETLYFAREVPVAASMPEAVRFYRITSDRNRLEQQVTRVVTVQKTEPDGTEIVHVRQIIKVGMNGFEVFFGKHDGGVDVSYVFPVPSGATVIQLLVNERDQVAREPKQYSSWSFGTGIRDPIFPMRGLSIMGTYTLRVPRRETVDLGLHTDLRTRIFTLAVERERMYYADRERADAHLRPVDEMGQEMNVPREMLIYAAEGIPRGVAISAPIVLSKDPITARTLWVIVAIVVTVAGSSITGLVIANGRRRRAMLVAPRSQAGGAGHSARPVSPAPASFDLDLRVARGEISVEEYRRLRAVQEVPAEPILKALEVIATRKGAGAAEVAEDVRFLARALREELARRRD